MSIIRALCLVFFFFLATSAQAAEVYLVKIETTPPLPGVVSVDVLIDAANAPFNALSGVLSYSRDLLVLDSVSTKNSIIDLWIENPKEVRTGTVSFAGLIPGGFIGVRSAFYDGFKAGKVVTLTFHSLKSGQATVTLEHGSVALHDGQGTEVPLETTSLTVLVTASNTPVAKPVPPVARELSRDAVHIEQNSLIADGKWYVSVALDGNEVSVQSYQVVESHIANPQDIPTFLWKDMHGPYVLSDQSRSNYVHIRVMGSTGAEGYLTLEPLPSQQKTMLARSLLIFITLVLIGVLGMLFLKKRNEHL